MRGLVNYPPRRLRNRCLARLSSTAAIKKRLIYTAAEPKAIRGLPLMTSAGGRWWKSEPSRGGCWDSVQTYFKEVPAICMKFINKTNYVSQLNYSYFHVNQQFILNLARRLLTFGNKKSRSGGANLPAKCMMSGVARAWTETFSIAKTDSWKDCTVSLLFEVRTPHNKRVLHSDISCFLCSIPDHSVCEPVDHLYQREEAESKAQTHKAADLKIILSKCMELSMIWCVLVKWSWLVSSWPLWNKELLESFHI